MSKKDADALLEKLLKKNQTPTRPKPTPNAQGQVITRNVKPLGQSRFNTSDFQDSSSSDIIVEETEDQENVCSLSSLRTSHNEKVNQLEMKIKGLQESLEKKNDELLQRGCILSDKENTIVQLISELEHFKKSNEAYEEQVQLDKNSCALENEKNGKLEKQLEDLNEALKERNKELQDSAALVLEKDRQIDELILKSKGFEENCYTLEKQLSLQRNKCKNLKDKVPELEMQLKDLQERMEKKNEESHHSSSVLSDKEKTIVQLNSELEHLKKSNETYEKQLRLDKNRCTLKNEKIGKLEKQLEDLNEVLNEKNKEMLGSATLLLEKDKQINDLTLKSDGFKENCHSLEEQMNLQRNRCTKHNEKITELEIKIKGLHVDLAKKNEELAECTHRLSEKDKRIAHLTSNVSVIKKACTVLDDQLKDFEGVISQRNQALEEVSLRLKKEEESKDEIAHHLLELKAENASLKQEVSRSITEFVRLKDNDLALQEALNEAVLKGETYKARVNSLQECILMLECEKKESETRLESTVKQQSKLIDHLQDQIEILTKKKKTLAERLFGLGKDGTSEHESTSHSGSGMLTSTPMARGAPHRILREHNIVKNLEQEASNLKDQLAKLHAAGRSQQEPCTQTDKEILSPKKESCILLHEQPEDEDVEEIQLKFSDSEGVDTVVICQKDASEFYINCIQHCMSSVYLLGCEEGLFSLKRGLEEMDKRVQIDGVTSVYQMEFLLKLNYCVMITGKDRELVLVHLGLLRACAEAAACSKPKVNFQPIENLKNCNLFQTQQTTGAGDVFIVVSFQAKLGILVWDKDTFVVKIVLNTPKVVTSILTTPHSVIFGSDNVYELDIKHNSLEELLDGSDPSLLYLMTTCRESAGYPVALLNVGLSNVTEGETNYKDEYLICFPDLGIFVDAYGRRSRPLDIIWSKLPRAIAYRHPYLYILQFTSVEIIKLTPTSFTKTRVGLTSNCIGEEVKDIPQSRFVYLSSPRILGQGFNETALIVADFGKSNGNGNVKNENITSMTPIF